MESSVLASDVRQSFAFMSRCNILLHLVWALQMVRDAGVKTHD